MRRALDTTPRVDGPQPTPVPQSARNNARRRGALRLPVLRSAGRAPRGRLLALRTHQAKTEVTQDEVLGGGAGAGERMVPVGTGRGHDNLLSITDRTVHLSYS
jgi:hypothetical protein